MIDITETEPSAAAVMVATGQAQIADLEQHISDLERHITEEQAAIAEIITAREKRATALLTSRTACEQASFQLSEANAYAQLAVGTTNDTAAVAKASSAKKAHREAEQALKKLERQGQEADRQADEAEQAHRQRAEQLQAERVAREEEKESVTLGLARASSELGAEMHAEHLRRCQDLQGRVESKKAELVAAQIEMHEAMEAALTALAPWPQLRSELLRLYPPSDPTTRVIVATMHYVATLLQDAQDVAIDFPTSSYSVWQVLTVPEGNLHYPSYLVERHAALQRLLDEYRAYLFGQGE